MIRLSRKVLCLDWDPRAVRLVVARTGPGQMELEDAHSHRLPNTVDPENPQSLGEFIRQMLRGHRWHYKRVIVDLPREKAVINRLTLPPTPMHEVAAAVRFQAMKELPFPLDDAVVDYVILKRDERGLATEVLLAAVPTDALATVQATCEAAGLTPARIGLRPYANLTSVVHLPGLAERRVLFVDIGPAMTEIDVIDSGQLAFARSANVNVPLSGDATSEDSTLGMITDVAGLENADEAIEVSVRELTVEITRTLQAYRAGEPEAVINRVLIAGGTGFEAQLLEAVDRRFGLPSALFDPTEALGVSPDEAGKLRAFSAALGLAWGLGRERSLAIDFLNPKKPIPPRAALKRRARIAGIAVGVAVVGLLGANEALYWRASGQAAAREKVVKDLKKELRRYLEIDNLVEEVQDWDTQAVWVEHLRNLTDSAIEPGKRMLVQNMTFDHRTAKITLKNVLAAQWDVPSEFVEQLKKVRVGGKLAYEVDLGTRKTSSRSGGKFENEMDSITVELLGLKKHLEERAKRVKDRKKRLKGL